MLLTIDGFDYKDDTSLATKYALYGGEIYTTTKRTGPSCFRLYANGGALQYNFSSASDTFVIGCAVNYIDDGANGYFWQLRSVTTNQVYINLNSGGSLYVWTPSGGQTSTETLLPGFNYFEFKVKVANSPNGYYILKINGETWLSDTGIDTQGASSSTCDNWRFYNNQNSKAWLIDDLYFLDDTGSTNNDFLGDCKVETLLPDGAGNYSQWTPTGEASNYLCVDDTDPDDDSTYVSISGTGFKDSYTMDDLATAQGTIYGVQASIYARKDDAGYIGIQPMYRISSTDYTISGGNLGDSYGLIENLRETSPATATAWTISEVNSLEFGFNKNV